MGITGRESIGQLFDDIEAITIKENEKAKYRALRTFLTEDDGKEDEGLAFGTMMAFIMALFDASSAFRHTVLRNLAERLADRLIDEGVIEPDQPLKMH